MLDRLGAFLSGLAVVFSWSTFSLMMIGIVVGLMVGTLPGLGGPTTLALMSPFIFKMNAVEVFAVLVGMSAASSTTEDITSILFRVSCEPTTAATIVDGHPMAKIRSSAQRRGSAERANLRGPWLHARDLWFRPDIGHSPLYVQPTVSVGWDRPDAGHHRAFCFSGDHRALHIPFPPGFPFFWFDGASLPGLDLRYPENAC